jgi:hypothetical protein
MRIPAEKGMNAMVIASCYLVALYLSGFIMWWMVLVGGDPITVKEAYLTNESNQITQIMHAGDPFAVRGVICSSEGIGIEVYPSIDGKDKVRYPLSSTVYLARKGCYKAAMGGIVPSVPAGEYSLNVTIKYQNNLVGRDSTSMLPPLPLRVVK